MKKVPEIAVCKAVRNSTFWQLR